MSAYVSLQAFRAFPGGVTSALRTMSVGGVDYDLPFPFAQISGAVVVAPMMESGEDGRSVSIRMDSWEVLHLDLSRRLPLALVDMGTAVRAAREFEADSGVSWDSDEADISAWACTWIERARSGGDR